MSNLPKLTPQQQVTFEAYQKKWLEIIFSTEPIEPEIAEQVINRFYHS